MRTILFPLLALAMALPAVAAPPVQRPKLAEEPLFSAGQVTDVDPAGTTQEAATFGAIQSLIERYGLGGVSYADKSVHKDWTITPDEAKVVLNSAFEQLAMLSNAAVENRLAESSDDDAAKIIDKYESVAGYILQGAPSCRLLVGTKYAATSKKAKPKPLSGTGTVSWAQALACLPGAGTMPVSARSYNLKPATPSVAITRGEFLHKLNESLEAATVELGDIALP